MVALADHQTPLMDKASSHDDFAVSVDKADCELGALDKEFQLGQVVAANYNVPQIAQIRESLEPCLPSATFLASPWLTSRMGK
jgi:hypothetical protein